MFVGKEGYLDLSFLWWQSRMNKSYFLLYCGRVREQSLYVGTVSISHCLPVKVEDFTFWVILEGAILGQDVCFYPKQKK